MRLVIASISGCVMAAVAYMVMWFFARNVVGGLGTRLQIAAHVAVVFVALAVGASSFLASLRR
jgi:hypothetical protein